MKKRSIFLAHDWSPPFNEFYQNLVDDLKNDWEIRQGPNIDTTPKEIGTVEKFRRKNSQLFDLFVKNIQASSIFVADITNMNPNVMIELGIAIKFNKNILVVSGTSKENIPFNVKGIEIEFYKSFAELKKKIKTYIDTFTMIKNMTFSKKIAGSYFKVDSGRIESDMNVARAGALGGGSVYRMDELPIKIPKMRDLRLRVEFRIEESIDESDWFGIIFRAAENKGAFEPQRLGSIMVNSRVNGETDITLYPGIIVPNIPNRSIHNPRSENGFRRLKVLLDNEYISVAGENNTFDYELSSLVNFGFLYVACYRSRVEYKNLEILNLDTTSEIF